MIPGDGLGKKHLRENRGDSSGFTLLEVLVGITVFALGATIALSLISGSLGNIRKVQSRIRIVEHANSVMELTLLDNAIQGPQTLTGFFDDGTRWSVNIEDYEPPVLEGLPPADSSQQKTSAKLLQYRVDMFYPNSYTADYQLQTLKLIMPPRENQPGRESTALMLSSSGQGAL